MYHFKITYSNGRKERFSHIEKAQYGDTILSGDEILTQAFPIDKDLHLFSCSSHSAISHKNIAKIEATKETPKPQPE